MFNVPQKYQINKPRPERDAYAFALYEKGMALDKIAHDPKFIEMTGGFILSRQRIHQIVRKFNKEQKSTD